MSRSSSYDPSRKPATGPRGGPFLRHRATSVGLLAVLSLLLGSDRGLSASDGPPHARAHLPAWFAQAPPLPPATGEVIRVATVDELFAAVDRLGSGDSVLLADGRYQLVRPLILHDKRTITLRGSSGDPSKTALVGRGWDTSAKNDDLLHVRRCEGVTLADLTFEDCRSYGVKVQAEDGPRDVHIRNCVFRNIGVRAIKGSAGNDPDVRAINGSVRYCTFENTRVPPSDWLFGGDYIAAIDMMALENWTFSDNAFRNIKGRNGGGRAAIFIWVRSRQVTVERNLILDCDRGIAFGNPGASTANRAGEKTLYVTNGIIRNNFIAGGPDCGIELWHAEGIQVLHNSIWRPQQNWNRGIRIGTGTARTTIVNNLVHGGIQIEGGEARVEHNLAESLNGFFAEPATGNLVLTERAARAIDQAEPTADVPTDIRGRLRGGRPDLGAWERDDRETRGSPP